MLIRKQNWEQAFHDFLLAHAEAPFVWGSNDCALFAADAVGAITGTDIAADFRGKYVDEAGAFAAIGAIAAGKTVADAAAYCATKFGLREYPGPLFAQRGDLVVMENGGALGLSSLIAGVVHLNGRQLIGMSKDGPVRLPLSLICRAWKV